MGKGRNFVYAGRFVQKDSRIFTDTCCALAGAFLLKVVTLPGMRPNVEPWNNAALFQGRFKGWARHRDSQNETVAPCMWSGETYSANQNVGTAAYMATQYTEGEAEQ